MGPTGWDAAGCWSAYLTVPTLTGRAQALLSDVLSTRSGMLPHLLQCASA
ncbi:hypothetical protein ACFWP7_18150 [Streptomyces sp. NPDC058470]